MPKILILRFSSIGDIVLTTPVIRCIKQQVSGCELHYCTKKNFRGILESNPHIDKVFCLEDKLDSLISELKKERYDYIIDLHNNLRTRIIALRLGVKTRRFDKLNMRKWLLVNWKINRMPSVHIVDRYMATASDLGVRNDGKGLEYYIPAKDEVHKEALPEAFRNGYAAFAIGAQHATKRLPNDKIMDFCRKISGPVILLGGKEDAEAGEKIGQKLNEEGYKIYNACGKYSLNQSASVTAGAQIVISHDTGLMHIAAAFKKEIYSVWGNTVPEFGMYPYATKHHILEVKGLPCRPCSKIGYPECPKGHFKCMQLQELKEINLPL